jgi:hypothetical protein
MSLTVQVLVLVLSFPAAGLLLYVLTIEEMRMLCDSADRKPQQRAGHVDQTPPERPTVTVSLAHRQHERATSSAAEADQEGAANPMVTVRPSGPAHSGVRLAPAGPLSGDRLDAQDVLVGQRNAARIHGVIVFGADQQVSDTCLLSASAAAFPSRRASDADRSHCSQNRIGSGSCTEPRVRVVSQVSPPPLKLHR